MISPKHAEFERSKSIANLIEDIEKSLDLYLVNTSPTEQGEYWYNITGFSSTVVNELVRIYKVAWDVRVVRDQRDGDALVLKAKHDIF